jgi:uridine kinase
MNIIQLSKINEKLTKDPSGFIHNVNAAYYANLQKITEDIKANREQRPIVLLSGPSGSGKTTTALMIEKILDEQGIETHTLSIDNYFSPFSPEEMKLFHEGKLDLESPNRIDKEFLSEHLSRIYRCEPVKLPTYDFKESARYFDGSVLHRKPGELVILEGIHSLNPEIIDFPDENTAKIYVSVRTRIKKNGEVLHPSKIRLMRRLVRDYLFRKRSFTDTLSMFHSVEEGENKYIMPYKYRSTYDVDTFMAYEICAYRSFLFEAFRKMSSNPLIADMMSFLEQAISLAQDEITPDSLICEFIGNGQFSY